MAGLEPEFTNTMLVKLAEAGKNAANLNLDDIASHVNGGGGAADDAPPAAKAPTPEPTKAPTPEPIKAPTPEPEQTKSSRRRSSTTTHAGSRGNSAASRGLGGFTVTRAVIHVPDGTDGESFVETTTRVLGSCIKRPKMAPKLLNKPPFRYIHDIVTNCMEVTGFPAGLFEGDELDSKALKETADKQSFLQKLINYVAAATGDTSLLETVNPKKIAAGLEPENTVYARR